MAFFLQMLSYACEFLCLCVTLFLLQHMAQIHSNYFITNIHDVFPSTYLNNSIKVEQGPTEKDYVYVFYLIFFLFFIIFFPYFPAEQFCTLVFDIFFRAFFTFMLKRYNLKLLRFEMYMC